MKSHSATITSVPNYVPDRSFIDRVKRFYRLAMTRFSGGDSVLWSRTATRQAAIHDAIMADDDEALIRFFSAPEKTRLYEGVDLFTTENVETALELYPRGLTGTNAPVFLLANLAEALRGQRYWNPEGGSQHPHGGARPEQDTEEILRRIQGVLSKPLTFPNPFNGEFGHPTSLGVASLRAVNAIYQAYRLHEVSLLAGRKVVEIGGGTGRTAYYAKTLFSFDEYTIVDLPMTCVAQALFLAATLGAESIWLFGEPQASKSGRIRLFPPRWTETEDEQFDVVLNCDSMTEMDRAQATDYVTRIVRLARIFISINHEANDFTVAELAGRVRSVRYPYWMRAGYIEELYFCKRWGEGPSFRAGVASLLRGGR